MNLVGHGTAGPSLTAITFVAAALSGSLGTYLARALAARVGLVSHPGSIVPQHTRSIACTGGLGIAFGLAASILLTSLLGSTIDLQPGRVLPPWWFILPGLGFLGLGVMDDLRRFSARLKLLLQMLLAAFAVSLGMRFQLTGIGPVDGGLTIAWIVLVVNAVNVTDVCDGLVGGIAVVAFLGWTVIAPASAPLALLLAGATLGFLWFNRPPASVFLGDGGSHLLGFGLAVLPCFAAPRTAWWPLAPQAALMIGPFLFESVLLIVVRRRKGLNWWQGSPDHFSLRLQGAGLSRAQTDAVAVAGMLCCCGGAWVLGHLPLAGQAVVGALVLLGAIAGGRIILRCEPQSAAPARSQPSKPPGRLLYINQNFVSLAEAGNSMRPTCLLTAFLDAGWSVDLLTSQRSYLKDEMQVASRPRVVTHRCGHLTIYRLPAAGGIHRRPVAYFEFIWRVLRLARALPRPDVVWVSSPPLPQVLAATFLSVIHRAPLLFEVRDMWPSTLFRLGMVRSRLAAVILRGMESLAYRYADHVVSASPGFRDYLVSAGVAPNRLTTAPTGVLSPATSRNTAAPPFKPDGKLVVFYGGSFNTGLYDLDLILSAARHADLANLPITWRLAGDGRQRPKVERAAAELPNLDYLGPLPYARLLEIYRHVDLAIDTVVPEPLLKLVIPGKLFDYLSHAIPVITTNYGLPGAILATSGGGVVLHDRTGPALCSAVARYINRASELEAMGRRGQAWARQHFSMARSASSMVHAAEQIREPRPQRSFLLQAGTASLRASADLVTRRGARATARVLREPRSRAHAALARWLQETEHETARSPVTPLEISALWWGIPDNPAAALTSMATPVADLPRVRA